MDAIYAAKEVSHLAGFAKPWMLGHLERERIFIRENDSGPHHGKHRQYTFTDLLVLRSINRMLDLGMRPVRIKDVIQKIKEIEAFTTDREAAESLVHTIGVRLFITKTSAHLVLNENEIVSLTENGQLAFGFMVDLKSALGSVVKLARDYEAKRRKNLKVDMQILDEMCRAVGV